MNFYQYILFVSGIKYRFNWSTLNNNFIFCKSSEKPFSKSRILYCKETLDKTICMFRHVQVVTWLAKQIRLSAAICFLRHSFQFLSFSYVLLFVEVSVRNYCLHWLVLNKTITILTVVSGWWNWALECYFHKAQRKYNITDDVCVVKGLKAPRKQVLNLKFVDKWPNLCLNIFIPIN